MNPDSRPPPLDAHVERKATLSPIVLSALVYPGAGQLAQHRWWTGGGIALLFTGVLVWFVMNVVAVLKAYYAFAFDFKAATGQAPGVGRMVLPFVCCTLIYLIGLVDTAVASCRIRSVRGRPIS